MEKSDGNGVVWHEDDGRYAHDQVQVNWDVWQAKRRAVRAGCPGEFEKYRRYPGAEKKKTRTPVKLENVECSCMVCGTSLVRKRHSLEKSIKDNGGPWCTKCRYSVAGEGRKVQWLRQRK